MTSLDEITNIAFDLIPDRHCFKITGRELYDEKIIISLDRINSSYCQECHRNHSDHCGACLIVINDNVYRSCWGSNNRTQNLIGSISKEPKGSNLRAQSTFSREPRLTMEQTKMDDYYIMLFNKAKDDEERMKVYCETMKYFHEKVFPLFPKELLDSKPFSEVSERRETLRKNCLHFTYNGGQWLTDAYQKYYGRHLQDDTISTCFTGEYDIDGNKKPYSKL